MTRAKPAKEHVIIALSLALAACGGATGSPAVAGNSYGQCVSHPSGLTAGGLPASATIDALLPTGEQVRCADSTSFTLDGRHVALVFVAYGELRDCPAGCFTSEVCAIYDEGEPLLL
jgi:hypothetical protein